MLALSLFSSIYSVAAVCWAWHGNGESRSRVPLEERVVARLEGAT